MFEGLLGDSKRRVDSDSLIILLQKRLSVPSFLPSLLQKKVLRDLEDNLKNLHAQQISNKTKQAELKRLIFQYYLDAYLNERKPNCFSKAIELGNLLKFFEEMLTELGMVKLTTSAESTPEVDHRNFMNILVLKEEINYLTTHAFKRGIKEGFTGTRDSKRIFVNAINAVVRMGENAIATWNKQLASQIQSDNNLHFIPKKDAEGKNRTESNLESLHEILKRDVQFLQSIRSIDI